MNNALGKAIALSVVLTTVCCFVSTTISCKRKERETRDIETRANKQKVTAIKRAQRARLIQSLVNKHDAVADWRQKFFQKDAYFAKYPVYTIQVEDVLVRTDSRPVMFVADIEDVAKNGDRYTLHFSESRVFGFLSNPYFHFDLHCTQDQLNQIMQDHDGYNVPFPPAHYAVIAHISGVRKVRYQLVARADRVVSHDDGDFEVNISESVEPSNIFVARGQCVDLLFLGGPADAMATPSQRP